VTPYRPGCPLGLRPLGWRCECGGGFLNGVSEDGGRLELWLSLARRASKLPDALAQMLNERRLLRHPFMQPLKLVVKVFRRMG